jgi:vitamin B12 transporter
VRGADAGHTAVLVDGVPLSRAASAAADLGRYELESVSELELYRGGVPIELGGGGLGGALNLVTRVGRPPDGRRLRLSAGVGSFGARHLRARWLDGGGDDPGVPEGVHLSIGYAGAAGDFVYFNDNGTNLDPDDDEMVRRQNNAYEQVDAVARRRVARGDTTLSAGVRALYKTQGVPGSASVQSEHTSLETLSQIGDVSVARRGAFGVRHLLAVASAFAAVEQQRYRDLHGEIGLGAQHRRYRSLSAGGAARATAPVGARHVVSAGLDVRVDHFAERDLADPDRAMPRALGRVLGAGVAASDEIAFGGDRLVVQPAVRVELLRTDPIADANSPVVGPMDLAARTDVYASPRVAARLRLAEGLVTKGSAGHYARAPTLLELFGDRGWIVGNPRLRPESGLSADLGLVLAPARALGAVDRLYLESAVFGRRARDAIVFIPTAGLVTIARNHGDADIGGLEVAAAARLWRTATVSGNYTLLATRQRSPQPSYDGKELPHRPRHQLYGRVDVARALGERVVVLWGDASVTSENFLDPANTNPVPARRLFGAGLKFEPVVGLLVGLEAKNLTDERVEHISLDPPPRPDLTSAPRAVSDFFGYPLPGRSYYLTVEWTH